MLGFCRLAKVFVRKDAIFKIEKKRSRDTWTLYQYLVIRN